MDEYGLDDLIREVLSNRDARVAATENKARRKLASVFASGRLERGLTIKDMAKELGVSVSQIRRLLHIELGGTLRLATLFRAADAFNLVLTIDIQEAQ